MRLFVSYEVSPFTAGGVGTYFDHVLNISRRDRVDIGILFGLPQSQVDPIRSAINSQMGQADWQPKIFSAFELATEKPRNGVFWDRSKLFSDAILKILDVYNIEEIEFFDYCGPAYSFLMERLINPSLQHIRVSIRIHNTIEIIDRATGRIQDMGPECPYGIERAAIALADQIITPGQLFWDQSALPLYGPCKERLICIPPPISEERLTKVHSKRSGIAFVGRPSLIKGFDTFLAALDLLETKLPKDGMPEITIIGPVETVTGSIDLESALKTRPRLKKKIRALGHLAPAELRGLIGGFDIVVFPNRTESYCYALHEARSAGCRIVANALPAFVEHVPETEQARIFDGTAAGLAEQIEFLLNQTDSRGPAEIESLRQSYVAKSSSVFEPVPNIDAPKEVIVAIANTGPVAATRQFFDSKWSQARPNDAYFDEASLMQLPQAHRLVFCVSAFSRHVTREMITRATEILTRNPNFDCVAMFSSLHEAEVLNLDPKTDTHLLNRTPDVVVWRFWSIEKAQDHLARGIAKLADPRKISRVSNPVWIGRRLDDYEIAPNDSTASLLPYIQRAKGSPSALSQLAERLLSASKLDPDSVYMLVVRGSIGLEPANLNKRNPILCEILFGFGMDNNLFSGLRVFPEAEPPFVSSPSAEIWTYVGGHKTESVVNSGPMRFESGFLQTLDEGLNLTLNVGTTDYLGRSISAVVGEVAAVAQLHSSQGADVSWRFATIEEAVLKLAQVSGASVELWLEGFELASDDISRLRVSTQKCANVRIGLFVPDTYFYSQKWDTHVGVLQALVASKDNQNNFEVKVYCSKEIAGYFLELGFSVLELPFAQRNRKRARTLGSLLGLPKAIKLLLSSTGEFSGFYGHTLSALKILQHRRPNLKLTADILNPNEPSAHLISDLELSKSVRVIKVASNKTYDLVVEIHPDGKLSDPGHAALIDGAAGILSTSARNWLDGSVSATYLDQWEASDLIADALENTIKELADV
jgi:glycosyltransferase involved in cell wall biosynthesis